MVFTTRILYMTLTVEILLNLASQPFKSLLKLLQSLIHFCMIFEVRSQFFKDFGQESVANSFAFKSKCYGCR